MGRGLHTCAVMTHRTISPLTSTPSFSLQVLVAQTSAQFDNACFFPSLQPPVLLVVCGNATVSSISVRSGLVSPLSCSFLTSDTRTLSLMLFIEQLLWWLPCDTGLLSLIHTSCLLKFLLPGSHKEVRKENCVCVCVYVCAHTHTYMSMHACMCMCGGDIILYTHVRSRARHVH